MRLEMKLVIMFRQPLLFALPFVAAVAACGGATVPNSDVSPQEQKRTAEVPAVSDDRTAGHRVDVSDAPPGPVGPVGPAPSSLSGVFVIKGQTLGGARREQDKCTSGTTSYAVDLTTKHVTIERCKGGPGEGDAAITQTTLDRTLTADELAAIQKEFAALEEERMPSSCWYDGHAYSLEVGAVEYIDADYNCNHRTGARYVSSLFPLAAVISALDGSTESPF